jgi:hypothetical protein
MTSSIDDGALPKTRRFLSFQIVQATRSSIKSNKALMPGQCAPSAGSTTRLGRSRYPASEEAGAKVPTAHAKPTWKTRIQGTGGSPSPVPNHIRRTYRHPEVNVACDARRSIGNGEGPARRKALPTAVPWCAKALCPQKPCRICKERSIR